MLKLLVRLIVVALLIASGGIVGETGAMAEACNRTDSVVAMQNSADIQFSRAEPTGERVMPCCQTRILCSGLVGCAGITVGLSYSYVDGRAVSAVEHQFLFMNGAIGISRKPVLPPPVI